VNGDVDVGVLCICIAVGPSVDIFLNYIKYPGGCIFPTKQFERAFVHICMFIQEETACFSWDLVKKVTFLSLLVSYFFSLYSFSLSLEVGEKSVSSMLLNNVVFYVP